MGREEGGYFKVFNLTFFENKEEFSNLRLTPF